MAVVWRLKDEEGTTKAEALKGWEIGNRRG